MNIVPLAIYLFSTAFTVRNDVNFVLDDYS
jgi:hypothetical protein